jgi:hypothetical protein
MAPFHLPANLLNSTTTTTTMWAANQNGAPAIYHLPGLLPPADWTAFMPLLVIVLALAATNKSRVMQLIVSAFRLGRRALIYLVERAGSIIVDRLLEMLIVALIAIMASVPWLTNFASVLGRLFH